MSNCGNHVHDRIIGRRGEVCTHKASLAPPLLIACSNQDNCTVMYMCAKGASFYDFSVGLWTCSGNGVFLFCFNFYTMINILCDEQKILIVIYNTGK